MYWARGTVTSSALSDIFSLSLGTLQIDVLPFFNMGVQIQFSASAILVTAGPLKMSHVRHCNVLLRGSHYVTDHFQQLFFSLWPRMLTSEALTVRITINYPTKIAANCICFT